jgi:hypothetical protein
MTSQEAYKQDLAVFIRQYYLEPVLKTAQHLPQSFFYQAPGLPTPKEGSLPRDADLLAILNRVERNLLIIGEAGGGKTYTLWRITQLLLQRMESDKGAPLPVLLSLGTWHERTGGFEIWAKEAIHHQYSLDEERVKGYWKSYQFHLLLDDFDLLPPELQRAFWREFIEYSKGQKPYLHVTVALNTAHSQYAPVFDKTIHLQALPDQAPQMIPPINDQLQNTLPFLAYQMRQDGQKIFFLSDIGSTWSRRGMLELSGLAFFINLGLIILWAYLPLFIFAVVQMGLLEAILYAPILFVTLIFVNLLGPIIATFNNPSYLKTQIKPFWFDPLPKNETAAAIQKALKPSPMSLYFWDAFARSAFNFFVAWMLINLVLVGLVLFPNIENLSAASPLLRLLFIISLGGLFFTSLSWSLSGGYTWSGHFAMRVFLAWDGCLPWNLEKVLAEAVASGAMIPFGAGLYFPNTAQHLYWAGLYEATAAESAKREIPSLPMPIPISATPNENENRPSLRVPYTFEEARDKIEAAFHNKILRDKYNLSSYHPSFEFERGYWNFAIVQPYRGNKEKIFRVDIFSLPEGGIVLQWAKYQNEAYRWFMVLGGAVIGFTMLLIPFWNGEDQPNTACFIPLGFFIFGMFAANSNRKFDHFLLEALDQVPEREVIPEQSLRWWLDLLVTLGFILTPVISILTLVFSLLGVSAWVDLGLASLLVLSPVIGLFIVVWVLQEEAYNFFPNFIATVGRLDYPAAHTLLDEKYEFYSWWSWHQNQFEVTKAELLFYEGRWEEHEALRKTLISQGSRFMKSRDQVLHQAYLGYVALLKGDLAEARVLLLPAYTSDTTLFITNSFLAEFYLRSGEALEKVTGLLAEARFAIDVSMLAKKAEEAHYQNLMALEAWLLAHQGRDSEARARLQEGEALPTNYLPGRALFYYRAAQVMRQLGDDSGARAYAERAIAIEPGGGAARATKLFLQALGGTGV